MVDADGIRVRIAASHTTTTYICLPARCELPRTSLFMISSLSRVENLEREATKRDLERGKPQLQAKIIGAKACASSSAIGNLL